MEEELGFGVHGMVWSTDQKSVIKVHGSEPLYYERERDIYLRLREHGVRKVLEFHVPEMRAFDDELLALEIAIVQPPFVIDFAGAYLDQEPDKGTAASPGKCEDRNARRETAGTLISADSH